MNVVLLMLGDGCSMLLICVLHLYTYDSDQVWICKYITVELAKAHNTEFMPTAGEQAVPHLVESLLV